MSLRNALLALLTVEPMTGYDLAKRFGSSVGNVWHAPDSQIYPELRRMLQDGLLESEEVPWGRKGRKIEYTITDKGRQAFGEWMESDLQWTRDRDPMHLRAAYFEYASPDRARAQLAAYRDHIQQIRSMWQQQIDEVVAGTSETLNRRLESVPVSQHRRSTAFKKFTYEGLVARADAELAWADRGLKLLDELDELDRIDQANGLEKSTGTAGASSAAGGPSAADASSTADLAGTSDDGAGTDAEPASGDGTDVGPRHLIQRT
ncbi:PadR family transcriptional regulator [Citricoccus sp. GCM10030269]|uniref:PadR family transcriptional regulator n=1 Tax=Citricoccus sp. GCM10030269 TaxID=3273388 RepID=UPI00360AE0F6